MRAPFDIAPCKVLYDRSRSQRPTSGPTFGRLAAATKIDLALCMEATSAPLCDLVNVALLTLLN